MGELYNPYPKLPKNIRQIGERDQIVKLYVEDYVNTYLKRLNPSGGQDLRVGLLLGNVEMHDGTPYVFIDGAMEMEDVTEEGEKVEFTEAAWKKAYQNVEQMFPKRTVQGWFLCGTPGCQLSPLNYWKQHIKYFQGQYKLMYLNSGLEGDESVYITSEDGFYKLRGHSIYYERNQMMQDYMILRKDVRRVESGVNDTVIRDFRDRMGERKEEITEQHHTISLLGGLCTAMSIVILAGGIVMFNNYEKMQDMESAIASAIPKVTSATEDATYDSSKEGASDDVVLEEAEGGVYLTMEKETMAVTVPELSVKNDNESTEPGTGGNSEVVNQESANISESRTNLDSTSETKAAAEETKAVPSNITPSLTEGQQYYTVGEGETLYGICLKVYHDLSRIDEICKLNKLDDQNKITSGQKLILP